MLSSSAAARPRCDRKDQKVVHAVTIGATKTSQRQKGPETSSFCHRRLQKDLAVTEKTRKLCMLSPFAAARPCSDRKHQTVVYAVTIGCSKTSQ